MDELWNSRVEELLVCGNDTSSREETRKEEGKVAQGLSVEGYCFAAQTRTRNYSSSNDNVNPKPFNTTLSS